MFGGGQISGHGSVPDSRRLYLNKAGGGLRLCQRLRRPPTSNYIVILVGTAADRCHGNEPGHIAVAHDVTAVCQ